MNPESVKLWGLLALVAIVFGANRWVERRYAQVFG